MASKTIVIVGGGFGGAYTAQSLEKTMRGQDVEIVLIDHHNYFIFYPLLVEAGTGSVEPRHAVIPIRDFISDTRFIMASVNKVDVGSKTVNYKLVGDTKTQAIQYDELVIALGSVTMIPPEKFVTGVRENAMQLKSLSDAVALRDRAIQLLELANAIEDPKERKRLLTTVVIGGSFTGVEALGELEVFMRKAARLYGAVNPSDCRFVLVEMAPQLLSVMGDKLSKFTEEALLKRDIDVRLSTSVKHIADDHIILDSGERVESCTTIWCAGISPHPMNKELGLPLNERGYIECEADMRVKGFDNVWALGDTAFNPDPEGKPYPPLAQHAMRMGKHLGKNIAAKSRGKATKPFVFNILGSLVAMGRHQGVAKILGMKVEGFGAWMMWRMIYLMKMPRFGRRVRVALDWFIDSFTRHDVSQLWANRTLHFHNDEPEDGQEGS